MTARIYRPAKSAIQSGRGKTKAWRLEVANDVKRTADPVMGWTGVNDTANQVKLEFDTVEQAVAYAKREGLAYTVESPRERKRLVKSYAENFSTDRKQPWTH